MKYTELTDVQRAYCAGAIQALSNRKGTILSTKEEWLHTLAHFLAEEFEDETVDEIETWSQADKEICENEAISSNNGAVPTGDAARYCADATERANVI